MAVEVVYRSSRDLERLFMDKAEADRHDKMLELAEYLAECAEKAVPSLTEAANRRSRDLHGEEPRCVRPGVQEPAGCTIGADQRASRDSASGRSGGTGRSTGQTSQSGKSREVIRFESKRSQPSTAPVWEQVFLLELPKAAIFCFLIFKSPVQHLLRQLIRHPRR
jgi:hypothetical protein